MSETYPLISSEAIMVSQTSSVNILLILICLLLRFSIGHSLQVKKSSVGTDVKLQAAEHGSVKAEQMHEAGVGGEMEEWRRLFNGSGRKMEAAATRPSSKAIKYESEKRWSNGAATASTTSGKVHCIGNGEGKKGGRQGCVNSKRKFNKRSGVNMSGFVPWNADYNVPRPHPPRNN